MKSPLTDRAFPLASVIIINWNNYAMTRACINRVLENTAYPHYEIWLIDNGSVDGSFEKLKKDFPFLKTMANSENKGFPYALNQGYREAGGFYLAPLNNDALVLSGWLEEGIQVLESDLLIAVAGCREVTDAQAADPVTLERIRNEPNAQKMTLPVAWVTRKSMVEKIGYLDAEFFSPVYGEEADWNFRARNQGFKIIRVSRSLVIHHSSQDSKKILGNEKQFILMNFHRHRSMLFNLGILDLLRFVPGLGLIFVQAASAGMLGPLLKSYWMSVRDWKEILRQRRQKRGFVPFKEPEFTELIS
ncbi:MAG: glycosyltransferase family 2 protein [Candidatus Diapherotrites archaeon]|nr:glycosyltransferase family 2 protein [Candidatus Diapherotrites archaeon]